MNEKDKDPDLISAEHAQYLFGAQREVVTRPDPTDIDGVKAALRFLRFCKSKGWDKAMAIAWLLDEAEKIT